MQLGEDEYSLEVSQLTANVDLLTGESGLLRDHVTLQVIFPVGENFAVTAGRTYDGIRLGRASAAPAQVRSNPPPVRPDFR